MIGQRLRLARQSSRLSLRDLSDLTDNIVSAQAIQKYENDEMKPSSSVLMALSRALGVTERYLLNPDKIEFTGVESFAVNRELGAKSIQAIHARVLSAVERYLDIERAVPFAEVSWSPPRGFPYPVRSMEEAESAAVRLRAIWELGQRPLLQLAEFLEERGIRILLAPLEHNVPAVLCFVRRGNDPDIPVIVVNEDHKGEVQRFSLAQQLANLVLEMADIVDTKRLRDRFARAFLMVRETVIAAIGATRRSLTLGELVHLKALFGAAAAQITDRCLDLGIITAEERRRTLRKLRAIRISENSERRAECYAAGEV